MRYVPILILLAVGCPNPQQARGDDAPAAKPQETYAEAVARNEALLATMNANVGNYNSELNAVKEELKALKLTLDSLEGQVNDVHKLLTIDTEISIPVPGPPAEPTLAPPVKADAPPKDADRHTAGITFHGNRIDVAAWLSTPLTSKTRIGIGSKDSANRETVLAHLNSHGLEGDFSKYSREQLITLHSVAHIKDDLKPAKTIKTVVKAVIPPPMYSGGCANGQCQRPMTYYSRSRRRG